MVDLSLSADRHEIGTMTPRMASPERRFPAFNGFSLLSCLVTALCIIIFTSGFAFAQDTARAKGLPAAAFTISVHVNMVVLHATVLDRKNALVSGLGKENFQIFEDGVLQQMKYFSHEDIPVTVGLVIDNSGSMAPRRSDVIAAALAFARSSNPKDQMFIVNFNEKVSFALEDKTPFTNNVSQLEVALSTVRATGQTALYDAVDAALDHLSKGDRDKKILVIVSDGGDNASKHRLESVLAKAKRSDAIIYSIGIFDERNGDQNPAVLRRLATESGGQAFLPKSLNEVLPICERIARDIRGQYTFAYVPVNAIQDGTYRVVQVKTSTTGRNHLLVRTRGGYFAPAASASQTASGKTDEPR
jgi:VWFA-related protein